MSETTITPETGAATGDVRQARRTGRIRRLQPTDVGTDHAAQNRRRLSSPLRCQRIEDFRAATVAVAVAVAFDVPRSDSCSCSCL